MKPNDDVRPIAIGEVWYRLAASCALAALGHTGADLAPIQLGAGVAGGVEAACHAVQAALAADDEAMALHMDVRNAFNLLGRDAIFAAVKRECPALLPFVQWAYGAATDLIALGADADPLKSATGVRQGDPLSSLLFSISIHPVLTAVAAIVPTVAFIDDGTLVGRADKLREAFPVFVEGIKADDRNLEVQPTKCAIHGGDPAVAAALAAELGVQHQPEGIVSFGTPIGYAEFVAATIAARADGIVAEVQRLMALPLSSQMKWRMLHSSLSVRLEHLKRTVPWDLLAEGTQRVESAILDAAAAIFELRTDNSGETASMREAAMQQLTLPQRHAGFGLRRASRDDADAALLSGAAMAQAALADGAAACRPFDADGAVRAGLEERWQRLHPAYAADCGWSAEDGELTAEVVSACLPRVGHDVAHAIGERRGKAFLAACDLATAAGEIKAANLRSASSSAAAGFLNALPCVPTTRLSNMQFQTQGRFRLNLGLSTNAQLPPCTCRIGDATLADHSLVCNFTKGDAKLRHNLVTNPVRDGLRKAGAAVTVEPPYANLARTAAAAADAAGTKADLMAVFKGQILMTDTKVMHAAAQTYRRAAARKTGATAETGEKSKWRTFRENGGGDSGALFVPCVVEAQGWVGKELRRLVNQMGNEVAEKGGCKRTFVRHVYEGISCGLARGNTAMFVKGLCARLRKAGGAFQPAYEVCISDHCDE